MQAPDLSPLKDPSWLAGSALMLVCVAKAMQMIAPIFRPSNGNGHNAREDGRWQGEITTMLHQQQTLIEQLREQTIVTNQVLDKLTTMLAVHDLKVDKVAQKILQG